MRVVVGIVGFGEWEEHTSPFMQSIFRYEPCADVVVIDQGSPTPYPEMAHVHRIGNIGYAHGLNKAIEYAGGADWYILVNHDVRCEGPFISKFKKINPYMLYGLQYNSNAQAGKYIEGWIYVLSKQVLDEVGLFDEEYKIAGYEDVDYTMRARLSGIPIGIVELPFRHKKSNMRQNKERYPEIRMENRKHFERKFA